jgi:GT2 family glycosyltransferase
MVDLSIIVVNWNTRKLLKRCLECIYRTVENLSFEVLVVDNASGDGSSKMVRENFSWVKLIENAENVGFARANNQAIRLSNGRYVLLLNSDTEVQPGALRAMVEFLDSRPEAGAAGSRLLNPDGTLQPSCHPMPTLFREFWRLFHLDRLLRLASYGMGSWDLRSPREVDTVQGACLMLRREVLDVVGLLGEEYFMYSEETDLCFRLRQAGWSIYWVPEARVIHYGAQSTQQASAKMFFHLYHSKYLFFKNTGGWLSGVLFKLILLAASIVRVALSPLAYGLHRSRREQLLAKASLYRRLIVGLPMM